MAKQQSKIFYRLPGLLLRWELERVFESEFDYRIVTAGTTLDGSELFAVYRRPSDPCFYYMANSGHLAWPEPRGKGASK